MLVNYNGINTAIWIYEELKKGRLISEQFGRDELVNTIIDLGDYAKVLLVDKGDINDE